jgi:hypothetical protein
MRKNALMLFVGFVTGALPGGAVAVTVVAKEKIERLRRLTPVADLCLRHWDYVAPSSNIERVARSKGEAAQFLCRFSPRIFAMMASGPFKPLKGQSRQDLRGQVWMFGIIAALFVGGAGFFLWQDRGFSFPVFACLFFAAFIFTPAIPSLLELRRRRGRDL